MKHGIKCSLSLKRISRMHLLHGWDNPLRMQIHSIGNITPCWSTNTPSAQPVINSIRNYHIVASRALVLCPKQLFHNVGDCFVGKCILLAMTALENPPHCLRRIVSLERVDRRVWNWVLALASAKRVLWGLLVSMLQFSYVCE